MKRKISKFFERSIMLILLLFCLTICNTYAQYDDINKSVIDIKRMNDTLRIVTTNKIIYFPLGEFNNIKQLKENLNQFNFIQKKDNIVSLTLEKSKIKLFYDSEERLYQIVSGTIKDKEIILKNGIHIGETIENVINKYLENYSEEIRGLKVIEIESGLIGIWHYYEFRNGLLYEIKFVTDYQFEK